MFSPQLVEILVNTRHADLQREAAREHLARLVPREPTRWRSHLADALFGLAERLDPRAVPRIALN